MAIAHCALDRIEQVWRWLKPERRRIPDIEIADGPAGGFGSLRFRHDVPNRVRKAPHTLGHGNGRLG
jgi:hypothetical protein